MMKASIFYALALDASASPTDKTYANQRKAGEILNALYLKESNHPGIIHYIIHTFDYPGIAQLGLAAARRYAQVAPSSAHALRIYIFTDWVCGMIAFNPIHNRWLLPNVMPNQPVSRDIGMKNCMVSITWSMLYLQKGIIKRQMNYRNM